jgi:hypothetical protein
MAQSISRNSDTRQLQILTNFTNVLFMTQKLLFGVLFGPQESVDPTSLSMKTDKDITVIPKFYTVVINEFLAPKLPPNHDFCFQQDGATAHTAEIRTVALRALVSSKG